MHCTESEFIKLSYTANDFPGLAAVVDSLFFPRDSEDQWPVRLEEIFNEYETLVSETGHVWILDFLSSGGTLFEKKIYSLPKLTEEVDKIGTLPTEYATVGAALSAIKGIAEEAKQKAEAAIPDPKAEGATGKFVLTVDVVGDNATYRWEKIERATGETTTTE